MRENKVLSAQEAPLYARRERHIADCLEIREAVSGFVSYFGTYSIDEAARKVRHTLEAALVPGWVGTTLVRSFVIDPSGQLILTRELPGEKDVLLWRSMAD